eukprot:5145417-Amphidinium_carterae.1
MIECKVRTHIPGLAQTDNSTAAGPSLPNANHGWSSQSKCMRLMLRAWALEVTYRHGAGKQTSNAAKSRSESTCQGHSSLVSYTSSKRNPS